MKLMRLFFLFLAVGLMTTSCGDDEEGTTCEIATCIVGTWNVNANGTDDGTITFNADNTGSTSSEMLSSTLFELTEFSWTIDSDGDLDITYEGDAGGFESTIYLVQRSTEESIELGKIDLSAIGNLLSGEIPTVPITLTK